jgi:DHA2 family multidrug resistance protein
MKNPVLVWLGFSAMCLGMFVAILDIQVVASSLTNIGASLDIADDGLGWIQTGYLTAEVIAIPLTGLLTRAFTLRWMFVVATVGFTLASVGCALCDSGEALIAIRVAQGFFGGMLIPPVFTSVFILIPEKQQFIATTVAGAVAMIAPVVGPLVGGYLTEAYSWRAIFIVNVVPGFVVAALVASCVRVGTADFSALKKIDFATMILVSIFLATLEVALNEGPRHDWRGTYMFSFEAVCVVAGVLAVWRALRHASPFIDLRRFRKRSFTIGCGFSFVLGSGLYGSIYLLALFLGLVRGHSPLMIGEVMIVTGVSRLLMSPIAAYLEVRMNARLLTAIGFAVFGIGAFVNGFATFATDYDELFWPQILRGVAMMLCLLPATRLALDGWPDSEIADASGLFNLMRNLGGAIGIALIDTIVTQRTQGHAAVLVEQLRAGSAEAARLIGVPALAPDQASAWLDQTTRALIEPLVRRAALTESMNDAWFLLAVLFAAALLMVPAMRPTKRA